jgi:hypothetical protein
MTEQEHATAPATTASPYLSLRQAVRPAIVAHRLLAADQERAGKLAAECEELLLLTRELLKATGQAHVLATEPGREVPHEHGSGRQAQLLDAYADAGMFWAKVVGATVALARMLLDRGDWDEVRQLAAFFATAGEDNAAAYLQAELGKEVWEHYRGQLHGISNKMPPGEIRRTIDVLRAILREVPADFTGRDAKVNRLLPPLAASIYAIMKSQDTEVSHDSRVEHIATGGVAGYPDIVEMSLDELSAEFEGLYR